MKKNIFFVFIAFSNFILNIRNMYNTGIAMDENYIESEYSNYFNMFCWISFLLSFVLLLIVIFFVAGSKRKE